MMVIVSWNRVRFYAGASINYTIWQFLLVYFDVAEYGAIVCEYVY